MIISRQKITGWVIVIFAVGYLAYLWKVRMFASPPMDRKEWIYFFGMIGLVMLGTINIRMANMRLEKLRREKEQARKVTRT